MQLFVVPRSIPIVFAMLSVSFVLMSCTSENLSRKYQISQRKTPIRTPPATTSAAPPKRRGPTSSCRRSRSAESADAPERLGRDERRDDRDAAAVVGLEQADVREAEEEPGEHERAQTRDAEAGAG